MWLNLAYLDACLAQNQKKEDIATVFWNQKDQKQILYSLLDDSLNKL